MYTDWFLIRRLAAELSQRFRGARVQDVGQLDDGRTAIALWARGATALVCIDIFAPTPVITVEESELPIAVEPGFVRAAGAALRGKTLSGVKARKGDRLLRFEFTSRSRFGVADSYALVCELVPRFGNIVLLRNDTVVAAAKEFAPSENALRSVQAGDLYELPPLRPGKGSPLLTEEQCAQLAAELPSGDLYVYRDEHGAPLQAHLVPLEKYAGVTPERSGSLLELLAQARRSNGRSQETDRAAKRRRALERTLAERERKARGELARVEARLHDSAARESLREAGEAIYATLHELPPAERDSAKERAADLFAQYKKAANASDHLLRREGELSTALSDVAALRWELERASDGELDDVAQALESARPQAARPKTPQRKRKPQQYITRSGSRIYVGRTPLENADLTFRVARPDDLWFHVQGQPGAHVILQRDDKSAPPEADVLAAAALAALHSKGKSSPKVTVDYTQRKHVRKRPAAAPGLVFYTHPRTVLVAPGEPEAVTPTR